MAVSMHVNSAINELNARMIDIETLISANSSFDSTEVHRVRLKINQTLSEIFGINSDVCRNGAYSCLFDAMLFYNANTWTERQMIFQASLPLAQSKIKFLIKKVVDQSGLPFSSLPKSQPFRGGDSAAA